MWETLCFQTNFICQIKGHQTSLLGWHGICKRELEPMEYVQIYAALHTRSKYIISMLDSKVPGLELFYYIFCGCDCPVVTRPVKPDETPRPDLTMYLSPCHVDFHVIVNELPLLSGLPAHCSRFAGSSATRAEK